MAENLTIPQIHQLHVITDAAARSAKVRWLGDDSTTIHEGVARHIIQGPDNFGFVRGDQDVRDAYLRITSKTGLEMTVSVRRLMYLVEMGGFALDS